MGNVINSEQIGHDRTGALKCIKCLETFENFSSCKIHVINDHCYATPIQSPKRSIPIDSDDQQYSSTKKIRSAKSKRTKLDTNTDQSPIGSALKGVKTVKTKRSKDEILERLSSMTDEGFRMFNLGQDIDEMEIYQRARSIYRGKDCVKMIEFQKDKIAWAQWRRHIWWPCVIEKFSQQSFGKYQVWVRYYEMNGLSSLFKLDPIKVELFFRSEEHFNFKTIAPQMEARRYEFFVCYTRALQDFIKQLEAAEKSSKSSPIKPIETLVPMESEVKKDHYIDGKGYTLDEIKELAARADSEKLEKVKKEREKKSKRLLELILSQECKDYLKGIVNESTACARHQKYMSADPVTRRKELQFSATGPLISEHQIQVVNMVREVCPTDHEIMLRFSTYDYDVLYPEAVIWAIQKLDGVRYPTAEGKYKSGFGLTDEERVRKACNEILNNLSDNSDNSSDDQSSRGTCASSFDSADTLVDLNF